MKPVVAFALLFVVTLVVALFLLGVFDTKSRPSPTPPPPPPPSTNGSTGLAPSIPKEEPPPEMPPLTAPIRILTLGGEVRSYSEWLYQMWGNVPEVSWQAWYETPPRPGQTTHSANLPAIETTPSPDELDSVQVLVVADVNPAALPAAFWDRVGQRIGAGAMGLLVFPDYRYGKALADLEPLKPYMPVTAGAVVGVPPSGNVAGVQPEVRPFALTDAGAKHPASRLSEYPEWSQRMWAARVVGKGAWGTKFVHPVEGVKDGAAVLVSLPVPNGPALPALVASDATKGRVLWASGFFDIDWAAMRSTKSFDTMRALVFHWVVWLATPS